MKCNKKSEGILSIPTLHKQPVILGGLYSAIQDEFLPGQRLWKSDLVKQFRQTVHHPYQKTTWTSGQTRNEKYDFLEIVIGGITRKSLREAINPQQKYGILYWKKIFFVPSKRKKLL